MNWHTYIHCLLVMLRLANIARKKDVYLSAKI